MAEREHFEALLIELQDGWRRHLAKDDAQCRELRQAKETIERQSQIIRKLHGDVKELEAWKELVLSEEKNEYPED